MTVEQIIENVHKRTDRRAAKDQLDMKAELLIAIQEFCQEYDWFWRRKTVAINTVANTTTYDLSDPSGAALTDFDGMSNKEVLVFQNGELIGKAYPEFDVEEQEKLRESTDTGSPGKYFFAGSSTTLEINKPDAVYRLRIPYWATPQISPEELGPAVPLVPAQLHGILQDGLEVRVLRWLLGEDSSKYIAAKKEYDEKVQKASAKEDFAPGRVTEWRNRSSNDSIQSTR